MLYSEQTNWGRDFKYVVVSDPLPLGHVIRRMRIHYVYSPAKVNEQRFLAFLDDR